ncbi:MAG: ATPase [Firmicutes bacterium]|nr:ATPase [Bacillota bacterium]
MAEARIKHIFPGGNTVQGFYSLFDSVLEGMDHIFVIKGGPGTGKSTLMRKIGLAMFERGYDIEFLHCASDNDSLDGVIIPAIRVALVDGTAPHVAVLLRKTF